MILKELKWKNVLSYGNNYTTYTFKNGIDIISGSNGKGKSVLLDVITFALFGKPYRKIKLGELINITNKKNLSVELLFDVGNKQYKIIRGLKPNVFEIYIYKNDWELIPQDSHSKDYQKTLEDIIGINEVIFRQIIVLGTNLSNTKNFMELNKQEKEEFFSKITNSFLINIIMVALKEQIKEIETEFSNIQYKKSLLESDINSLNEEYKKIEENNNFLEKERDKKINALIEQNNELELSINKLKENLIDDERLQTYNKFMNAYNKLQNEIATKERHLNLLKNKKTIVCPQCGFEIGQKNDIEKLTDEINKLKEKYNNLESKFEKINDLLYKHDESNRKISELRMKINNNNYLIDEYKNIEYKNIDKSLLKAKIKELDKIKFTYDEVYTKLDKHKRLFDIFKNGTLKEYFIKKRLPHLNKHIQQFINKFGIQFQFVITETLKEKIYYRGKEVNFNNLSNGQKQRIILILLFSFLKMMEDNGYKINILVLDEFLDSSLDSDGIDLVLDILKMEFRNKNIIIITHNPLVNTISPNRQFEVINKFGFSELIKKD